jgi:hypothetical protein
MRKIPTTIAAAITLVTLGALTAVALQPTQKTSQAAAPVEVRTEVIRRTVRIVRHEKPPHPRLPRTSSAAAPPTHGNGRVAGFAGAPRTASSGAGRGTAGGGAGALARAQPVSTRTSGAGRSTPGSSTHSTPAAGKPVSTRTSGASTNGASGSKGSGAGSSKPISTKTSGGKGGDGKDHGGD